MFTHNYLVFDEFGIKHVLCMACSRPIKSRSEVRSELDPKIIIREMAKHADYREIPVVLSNNKLAFIMVCDDCKFTPIGENEARNISNQLRSALCSQLEYEGKLPEMIEAILNEQNFSIERKAEVHEVTAVLRRT